MSRSRTRSRSRSASRSPAYDGADDADACPFLVRLFITKNKHTPMSDFEDRKPPLKDEYQVYAWRHSTPSSLIRQLYPTFPAPYRSPLARFSFRHIYVDASPRGLYRHRDLLTFSGAELAAASTAGALDGAGPAKLDEKTLDAYGFVTGDLFSVALHVPEPQIRGAAAARAQAHGQGQGQGPAGLAARKPFGWDRDRDARKDDAKWGRGAPLPPQGRREVGNGASWRGGAPRGGGRERSAEGRQRDGGRDARRSPQARRRELSPDPRDRRGSFRRD
ncbi:hypothetical protein Q5752_004991 [Cryptotrichosporon argae]